METPNGSPSPGSSWKRRLFWKELQEKVCIWIAFRLPKRLAYWTAVRVVTRNCPGNPGDRTVYEVYAANDDLRCSS